MLFKIAKTGIHTMAHAGSVTVLLDVFGSLYEPYSAHDMVTVFHSKDFPNLFRDRYPSTCYYFGKERNVLFVNLNWQSDCRASECVGPVI
jgi:hypothetical protein